MQQREGGPLLGLVGPDGLLRAFGPQKTPRTVTFLKQITDDKVFRKQLIDDI